MDRNPLQVPSITAFEMEAAGVPVLMVCSLLMKPKRRTPEMGVQRHS